MGLYAAFDLHANNNSLAMIDQNYSRMLYKKLFNDPELILEVLRPHKENIVSIVVESTYNWYWMVDMLMEQGYKVHLANPAEIKKYTGLKHRDDRHDDFWLAELLVLGILPEGYIYPKQERPVRDLLRKRGHLVKLRTSLILSLQTIINRNCGIRLKVNDVKRLRENRVNPFLEANDDLAMAVMVSKESIDFLTHQIRRIKRVVHGKVQLKEPYRYLLTLPGVGTVLALTIMLETGPMSRFAKVGNFVSYCRKVSSQWISNGKRKGKGNQKSGNKYLAWAFSEAAELARRYHLQARAYYNRKMQKTNFMVAHSALSHKLTRAAYYIMRDHVPFKPEKLFS
jgi:transposase